MNTHAPDALLQTSQGDVAHEVPAQGKQQGAHGKIGSAGFAQILGEQVTKSTPKAKAAEMASEPSLSQAAPPSSTHATDQSSPQSLPHTTSQSLPAANEKPAPRVSAQVCPEGNEQTPPTLTHALPEVRQGVAYGEHRTSSLTQQVHKAKPGSPSVARNAQPATDANVVTLASVGTSKGSTETQRPEHQTAAILSARAGDVVDKSTSKTESRVQRTIEPNAEAPSTKTAQVTVHHDKARPAQQQLGNIRAAGPALDTQEVRLPTRETTSQSSGASATTARASELSASVQVSTSAQSPAGDISSVSSQPARMPTRSDRAFANQGQNTVDVHTLEGFSPHTTSQTNVARGADSQAPSPVPTSPPFHEHAHASARNYGRLESETTPSTRAKEEHAPVATLSRVTTKASETAVPLPPKPSNIVAHVTSAKPGDSAAPVPSSSDESVAPLPSSSSESAPVATLPFSSTHAALQAGAAKNTPISPNLRPEIPDETMRTPHGTGSESFAGTPAPHAEHPEATEHPVGAQVLPVPQASPAAVSQTNSSRAAFRPTATATAKVAVAAPTTNQAQAGVRQDDEFAEATTETRPAGPSVRQTGISSENTNRQATDTPPSVKQSPASPAPAASQGRNRSTAPVEPAAEKRRIQVGDEVGDEKESAEALAAPATSSQATPLPATSSPTLGIEDKPLRSVALHSAEHKTNADNTSQSNSASSTASLPHATKPDFAPVVLSSAERHVTFALPPTFIQASGEASVQEAAAPSPLAAERAGLVDRAIADPGLSVTVMPHSAHLSIASDAGDLALHVRVRDGSADVNVSGTMAPLFDAKAPEVRTVLAGQGLELGSFATDQRGNSQSQQGNPERAPRTNDLPPPPPRRTNTSTPEVQIADDRRIHVTA